MKTTHDSIQDLPIKKAKQASPTRSAPAGDWYRNATIYNVHVRAFSDSNADGMGDFLGLTHRLDYLTYLGVSAIAILPFYPSPWRDDGHDVSDFRSVHPAYRTPAAFRRFVQEAHRRELRVLINLPISCTSDQHPWFQAARAGRSKRARGRYVWSDRPDKFKDAPILLSNFETSNWTWDPIARDYYWHRFYSHEPALNFQNPDVLEDILGVLKFWFAQGVDGICLHGLPLLCMREGTTCENLPESHAVVKYFRTAVSAEYPGRLLVDSGEPYSAVYDPFFGTGDECHMAINRRIATRLMLALAAEDSQPLADLLVDRSALPADCHWITYARDEEPLDLRLLSVPEREFVLNALKTERKGIFNEGIRRRLINIVGNDANRALLAFGLLLSLPGSPMIYYGDEIGMADNIYLGDRYGLGLPMQWSPDRNAGFSSAPPECLYLPVTINPQFHYTAVNVENATADSASLLNRLRVLIRVRQPLSCFGRGTVEVLSVQNQRVLAYLRHYGSDSVLCVINLSRSAQSVFLDLHRFSGRAVPLELTTGTEFPPISDTPYLFTLPPYAFYWFSIQELAVDDRRRRKYHSCFISYSSKDEDFVRQLHADLVNSGVRCWFAAKDLRIGDRFRDKIHKSISTHDKLLLVLSVNSIESDWVEHEVEMAFNEEARRRTIESPSADRPTVLMPLRLDGAALDASVAWASDIRLSRHIGDFTGWPNAEKYKAALSILLDALV
jgi:maltose alpha-D-glucosyltransferase/alpha-amylase